MLLLSMAIKIDKECIVMLFSAKSRIAGWSQGGRIMAGVLMALLLFTGAPVAAAESPVLRQLLAEADNNPALGAAREQIAVSRARVPQQTSLEDPVLSLALSNY